MFDTLNTNIVDWNYDTEGFEYVKPSTLVEGQLYPAHGFFITSDNGYGEGAVAILDDVLLNMPQSYVDTIKKIRSDANMIEAIKSGHCAITVASYTPKRFPNKKGYRVEFKDI